MNAQLPGLDLSPDLSFETLSLNMLSRLPHEVRLDIFHIVFADVEHRGVIRVEDTATGIKFMIEGSRTEDKYAGALSCLDATMMGEGVAAAAAEALYQSEFRFGVGANDLCNFLQSCPLTNEVQPGRYIKNLDFFMDEDPKFIGDGKTGQDLRKADWVDLVPGPGDDRTTRSTKRTQLMRQCWRAILNMPKLQHFDFFIMPSQGQAWADVIQHFEIRDIIPMHFRLFCRNIVASIYFHIPDAHTIAAPKFEIETLLFTCFFAYSRSNSNASGHYESYVNFSYCIPSKWAEPTDERRAAVETLAARLGDRPPTNWLELCDSFRLHAIRNYDALRHYRRRLAADKSQYISQYFNADISLTCFRF